MDNTKELTHISLCTGYGGIDLGLKRAVANVRTVCYVEIESFVIENLVAKIEKGFLDLAPVYTDLKTFDWECFSNKVDILSGGFPCQPFSAAGRRSGDEDPRHLFPYIVDGIKRLGRPSIVFFENVEGIISSKLKGDQWSDPEGTPVLLYVLRELERVGYKATAGIFSASEVGAPHQRKRVFILGYRADLSDAGKQVIDGMLRATEQRQELGNTDDNGYSSTEIRGSDGASSYRGTQGKNSTCKPERASSFLQMVYPAPRGAEQYTYEPTRTTMGDTTCLGGHSRLQFSSGLSTKIDDRKTGVITRTDYDSDESVQREAEPTLGGNAHGCTDWLDYAELYTSCDNRTDELRMLGNGVVPATAERAFRTLWADLGNTTCLTTREYS